VAMYDAAVHVWYAVRKGLTLALHMTGTASQDVWKTFWSAQQRFFKLLCVSMKVGLARATSRAP
jgi:hypothetical protein